MFTAAYRLRDAAEFTEVERAWLEDVTGWFNENLARPARFTRSGGWRARRVALSWIKTSATEHVRRLHELATLLRDHGVATRVRRTTKPGYVVYEDEHQVVAEPFRGREG